MPTGQQWHALDALALLFLKLGGHQTTAAEILWGVWLLPLALLVYRSRFLPRFLGVWLVIKGAKPPAEEVARS